MENMIMNKDQLFDLLSKCYEEGYNGYLESKEDYINLLINNYISSKKSLEFNDLSLETGSSVSYNIPSLAYSTTNIVASNDVVSLTTVSTDKQTVFAFDY
jgi:hypothetical protein